MATKTAEQPALSSGKLGRKYEFGDINTAVEFDRLCDNCKSLCKLSPLLNGSFKGKYPWESKEDPPFDNTFSDPEFASYKFEGEYSLHNSVADLETSALNGCHLCALFWNNLTYEVYYRLEEENEQELRDYDQNLKQAAKTFMKALDSGPPGFRPNIAVRIGSGSPGGGPRGILSLYACLQGGRTLPQIRSTLLLMNTGFIDSMYGESPGRRAARTSISTESDATMDLAKQWIEACCGQHTRCRAVRTKDFSPPRLLKVPATSSDPVHLYLTTAEDCGVEYVALSHCWGGADIFKLTSATLAEMLGGISISVLPKTFVDAFTICRRLGVNYLWIDSLCIRQDDLSDWREHAAIMGQIYQNCIWSLAALGARNSSEGCFARRNPLSYAPLKLSNGPSFTITKRTSYPWHEEKFTRTPLLQRAWVVQERFMAPATLYFGKFGIQWECRESRADETQDRATLFLGTGDIEMKKMVDSLQLKKPVSKASVAEVYRFYRSWHDIVASFSAADLTFKTDKLVAIAGIVEFVQQHTNLTSFAGLWEELLLKEILWSLPDPLVCRKPLEYRAPSFSWASIDGIVRHEFYQFHDYSQVTGQPHVNEDYLAEITEKQVVTVDPTRNTGQVSEGFIRIRGPVKEISLRRASPTAPWKHPFDETVAETDEYPWFVPDSVEIARLLSINAICLTVARWTGPLHAHDSDEQDPTLFRDRHVAGLVLEQVQDTEREVYRRIGFFEDCYEADEPQWWEIGDLKEVEVV